MKLLATIVLIAVFAAGAIVGVTGDRAYLARYEKVVNFEGATLRLRLPENTNSDPETRRAADRGIPTPFEHLGLTPQQEDTLASISRRRRPRADSIMRALRPLSRQLETEMMQEMLCALTPAQQSHWAAYMDTLKFDPAVVAERMRPVQTHTCGVTHQ